MGSNLWKFKPALFTNNSLNYRCLYKGLLCVYPFEAFIDLVRHQITDHRLSLRSSRNVDPVIGFIQNLQTQDSQCFNTGVRTKLFREVWLVNECKQGLTVAQQASNFDRLS